jgi:hypothetical protein
MVAQAISAVALALLAASGFSKVLDPDPTRGAMAAANLPASRTVSRTLGSLEIAAGAAGLALGGVWVGLSALLYLGFLSFTLLAVVKGLPIQSCGCFGRDDTPPTWIHVGFNAVAAVVLGVVAVSNDPVAPWSAPVADLTLYLTFTVIGAYAAYLVLAQLPRTMQLTRLR